MIRLLYNIAVSMLGFYFKLSSIWNAKSALWLNGRIDQLERLKEWSSSTTSSSSVYWFHCASLGEYEEAMVFIDLLKKQSKSYKFLVSFFSPSGFENVKMDEHYMFKMYLPLDKHAALEPYLDLLNIKSFVLMKYDFWFNALSSLQARKIPIVLINNIIKDNDWKLRFKYSLSILKNFAGIWVSDKRSLESYKNKGFDNVYLLQDPRVKRALSLKNGVNPMEGYCETLEEKLIVFGSVYKEDFEFIDEALKRNAWSIIVAPHEMELVSDLQERFPQFSLASGLQKLEENGNLVIWDSIGQLKYLYKFASAAYVGGGRNKGLHNTFEAAVYRIPVMYSLSGKLTDEHHKIEGLSFKIERNKDLQHLLESIEQDKLKEGLQKADGYFNNFNSDYNQVIAMIEK